MRIKLSVTDGPHSGLEFSFDERQNFIVGRGKLAHFRLPDKDKFFSRIHFMVEVNPPLCRLMDMGSRNHTKVNGQVVTSIDLKDGDRIQAGKTTIQVSLTATEPPTEAEAGGATTLPEDPAGPTASLPPTVATPLDGTGATMLRGPEPLGPRCVGCGSAVDASAATGTDDGGTRVCAACEAFAREFMQPIEGYLLIRELGRGGMGVVYLALRRDDGTPVALKTIRPAVSGSRTQIERFLREASILEQLDHAHIVAFRATGESNGLLYFAMDYVAGQDASQLQKRLGGPLPVPRAVRLIDQMLDGLAYAHGRGFVHRDVKPANLLVETREGREFARVSDFGLARTYQGSRISGLTKQGDRGGTISYMAPEQITQFRESKPAVDQYAAAASLYHLLTGRLIYDLPHRYEEQVLMVLQDDPVPILSRRADLPPELAAVVQRALARDPNARFPEIAAFREALQPFA